MVELRKRKGQSAIEYLTTYGWMLLVVAIVGAAIFATIGDTEGNAPDIQEFGDEFRIEDPSVSSDGDLIFNVRNVEQAQKDIENVTLSNSDSSTFNDTVVTVPSNPEETKAIVVPNVSEADTENEFDLVIEFTQDELPGNFTESGTLTGNYEITS